MCSVSVAFCTVTASCGVSRNRVVCRWGLSAIVSTRYRTRQAQDWVVSTSAEAFARTFHDSSCKQCQLSVLVFNCHMRTLSNKAAISRRLSPRREESRVIASSVVSRRLSSRCASSSCSVSVASCAESCWCQSRLVVRRPAARCQSRRVRSLAALLCLSALCAVTASSGVSSSRRLSFRGFAEAVRRRRIHSRSVLSVFFT